MKIIDIKLILKSWIVFHLVCLCISSCRNYREEDKIPTVGLDVPVTINFAGVSRGSGDSTEDIDFTETQVIIKNKITSTNPVAINSQPKVLALGENSSVIAYMYLKYEDDNSSKVNGLRNGDKFRVVVYKKSDGTYHSHKDYVFGKPYEQIKLSRGVEYIVVSYTFGTKLPDILYSEKENINTANVRFDKNNSSLVAYQKQYFIPSDISNKNIININLFDQSSLVGVKLRSLGSGIPIEDTNIIIRYNESFATAKMNLNTGKLSCVSKCNKESQLIKDIGSGVDLSYDGQFLIPSDKKSISLDAKIRIFGSDEYFNDVYFYTLQGKKATVYIDLRVCGAYSGPNETKFKRFMCNDLGGDIINPSQNIVRREQHGDFYVWGLEDPILSRRFFQEVPQNREKWAFDWSDVAKEKLFRIEMPSRKFDFTCPEGWRVPKKTEWEDVAKNNDLKDLENDEPYTLGVRIGENMLFPISGFVGVNGISYLPKKGDGAYRWSYNDNPLTSKQRSKNAWMTSYYEKHKNSGVISAAKFTGISVRCIKN